MMSLQIKTVAVIGAGISGVSTAAHLKASGLEVTVFERTSKAGGVWVFDPRVPLEPAYPSTTPSIADAAYFKTKPNHQDDSDTTSLDSGIEINIDESYDSAIQHAPPGPCYEGLRNNVPTGLMETTLNAWKAGTEQIVLHDVLAEYIQDTAAKTGVDGITQFNTRVDLVEKVEKGQKGRKWHVKTTTVENGQTPVVKNWEFDAVVIASGHYHAPYVPDIPGLKEWKNTWPGRIQHSKRYRSPKPYKDKTVLLIGGSTSSSDIAKELEDISKKTYQSTRNGLFDHPASMLPPNAIRVGQIASFSSGLTNLESIDSKDHIPGTVTLVDGTILTDIDYVIICTGYHMAYPFMHPISKYHNDSLPSSTNNPDILVTDGQQTHNLHKDIFYIPDPTLAFIGVPYHIATFSLFDFQALALAAVFSGKAPLPTNQEMRTEYETRIAKKGSGRIFHSLMGKDVEYVDDLLGTVNPWIVKAGGAPLKGHSDAWKVQYEELRKRMAERKAAIDSALKSRPKVDRTVPYVAGIETTVNGENE